MRDFNAIVEIMKDILSNEMGDRVYDKDLAAELGVSALNFATMKKRQKICYLEISEFAAKRGICINYLLFNQDPQSLVSNTEKYMLKRLKAA